MGFDEAEDGEIVGHQVVEAIVHAGHGMMTIVRLVYLRAPHSPDLYTLWLSLMPLQSLKLTRDLLAAAEHYVIPPGRKRRRRRGRQLRSFVRRNG